MWQSLLADDRVCERVRIATTSADEVVGFGIRGPAWDDDREGSELYALYILEGHYGTGASGPGSSGSRECGPRLSRRGIGGQWLAEQQRRAGVVGMDSFNGYGRKPDTRRGAGERDAAYRQRQQTTTPRRSKDSAQER